MRRSFASKKNPLGVLLPAIVLLAGVSLFSTLKHSDEPQKLKNIKVGTRYRSSALALDPTNNETLNETSLLLNLYGQLVTFDKNDGLIPSVASSFSWQGDDLVFRFDQKIKTVDGLTVGAEDAALSLRRAMVLQSSDRTLKKILCPASAMRSIDDACEGLSVKGNSLILKPVKRSQGSLLLTLLGDVDYSIIPKANIDLSKKSYPLISHRNTSGAYYLEHDDPNGAWILKENANNPVFHSDGMPESVTLVPIDYADALEALESGRVDVIPTYIAPDARGEDGFGGHKSDYNLHYSLPLKLATICFSPEAVKNFTIEQRLFAARTLMSVYLKDVFLPEDQDTTQFFQGYTEASLEKEQLERIAKLRATNVRPKFNKPIRMSAGPATFEAMKKALKDYPEIEVVKNRDLATFLPLNERMDMYSLVTVFGGIDTSIILANAFADGVFHLPGLESEKWMKNYLGEDDRALQLKAVRSLHELLLSQVVVYPVKVMTYMTVLRKPLVTTSSKFRPHTLFWQIRSAP